MKLLDEIIDLLADENSSLNAALLKTKVLMHRIGHAELAEWVNDELNGYPQGKPVPEYRIMGGRPAGNIQSAIMIQADVDLPTYHLPEKLKMWISKHEMTQSMSVLQEIADAPTHTNFRMPLTPEMCAQISQAMDGHWVQKGWVEMQPLQIKNGIAQVRSRLLDFALKLKDEIGEVEEDEVKKAVASTDVQGLFHGAVFGDNATVIVGNQNQVKVSNVKKNDFDSLAKFLMSQGVTGTDVAELRTAVDADDGQVDVEKKTFGPAVKNWMTKMMGKVVDASWQIELGVAGGLLTEALKAFYF